MTKIGIIGYNGYIGSYIYDTLIKDGYSVIGLDYRYKPINITEISYLDIIIYTGGVTTRSLCSNISNEIINKNSINDIINISSKMNKEQLFIYMSTSAIYEGYGKIPQMESSQIYEDLLDQYTLSMYKKESAIADIKHINSIGLRIGMTCGISRKQRYDLAFMNMVHSSLTEGIIYKDINNPSRSILGLEDLYRCIVAIIYNSKSLKGAHIYNICSFNSDIFQLADFISSELKSSIKDVNNKSKAIGFSMNNEKFCKEFNFSFLETKESILYKFIENKDNFQSFTTKCRICKESSLELILDLGNQPLANNLLLNKDDICNIFPLNIYRCVNCCHTQLGCTISPLKMFDSYTYVSGVSKSTIEHFKMISEYLSLNSKGNNTVLEIASNDGCQLDFFKKNGYQTFGIDPASNICEISNKKGHTIICDYWGDKYFKILPPSFDIILAQNVLAHVPDPMKFIKKCIDYMTEDTILYLQTSQSEMYINNEFDTIYHEHMSFFTLESFKYLAEKSNLFIHDINKFSIHGVSYGIILKKMSSNQKHSSKFINLLEEEHSVGMYNTEFYYKYRSNVIKFKYDILNILEECKKDYTIVGYGAAAKGITMLNYIDFKDVEYIVDDCKFKYGKFTPGLKIPIVNKDVLINDMRNLLIIILPWNIKEELIQKIRSFVKGRTVRLLIPFPTISLI
jgi:nucleoside-diphosphate-sugar epimerase/2-polyprenyl-3-methyl-5-hydroxy-6-metoxy-1,4-benzoquinol methylase